jgi:hypothetical protein
MHSEFAKSANLTSNVLFSIKINYGVLKTNSFVLISNSLKWAQKNFPKENYRQKLCEFLSFAEFALFANVFACNFTKICGEILAVCRISTFCKF